MTEPTAPPPFPATAPEAASRRSGGATVPWVVAIALAALAGALLFAGGWLAAGGRAGSAGCATPDEAFAAFCEAYGRLQREYVDELDPEKLAEGAIRGMFEFGVEDPNSGYMPPEQYQQALGDLSGSFSGIGAEMAMTNIEDTADLAACTELSAICRLVVVAPLDGSPAEAAGIQAGDYVLAVDGTSVDGTTVNDQVSVIRGEAGTDVTLTIERDGAEPFDVTITRAEIELQEVETRMIDGHIGYIALNAFSAPASDQFAAGLQELLDQGADQIVFDLRDNPGGYIEAAQQIASQFIDEGLIFTQESAGDDTKEYRASGDGIATDPDLPVAVLINAGSASASEIVAAALQEAGRATIVGEASYGKNTVQVWSRLENDGGVRITISRWFTPGHNSVAPDGIQPDVPAARTAETPPEDDPVLDAALEHLAGAPVDEAAATPSSGAFSGRPAAVPVVGIVGARPIC
jgi:carboxyl-terminal processing protease